MTDALAFLDGIFLWGGKQVTGLVEDVAGSTIATLVAIFLPVLVVVAVFPLFFVFLTWVERKVLARIQNRLGPNRVGVFGLLQPLADGVKMMTKEDIVPRAADRVLHIMGPILVVAPTIAIYALLPFGKGMIPADVDVSLLLYFAISSMGTIALFCAGWGSNNKYSLLGAIRAIAQMISYELPVVMHAVPVVMIVGSLSLGDIVAAQGPASDAAAWHESFSRWFVWQPWGLVGFLAFFVAGMAELNRSPFDLSEAESEIVAGYHTEYSGMKFALFYMGEYLSAIAFSGLASALFLGGFHGPGFLPSWLWFVGKMFFLLGLMIWIRGTLPRLRVDQLMGFSWKFLLPLALVNIFATGAWHYLSGSFAWVVSAVIVFPAYVLLARINEARVVRKRDYKFADL